MIYAVTQGVIIENDIFHIIFFIALLSVGIQGTLIPTVAKKLDLVDDNTPVLKTFNDYDGEISSKLIEINVDDSSKWVNKSIMDSNIPEDILIVMIKRKEQVLVPKGSTVIKTGDTLVLSGDRIEELIQL